MINPSKKQESINSPVERASELNNPQFENNQGYFSYDLSHAEYLSPRFGEITPSCHLDTVPADRLVMSQASKLILNQIDGNFLSTINQYDDTFFVSLRSVFPNNYEKLMVNPTKGDDLPNSAHPVVPLWSLFYEYLYGENEYEISVGGDSINTTMWSIWNGLVERDFDLSELDMAERYLLIGRLTTLLTMISRGQLLDYFGMGFDDFANNIEVPENINSNIQYYIDRYFDLLYDLVKDNDFIVGKELKLTEDGLYIDDLYDVNDSTITIYEYDTLSEFRSALSDILERGEFPIIRLGTTSLEFSNVIQGIRSLFLSMFDSPIETAQEDYLTEVVDKDPTILSSIEVVNISRLLAYQQVVAQYYTNDTVDNVFNSDLYMENLRSVMFPTDFDTNIITREPVFSYNGRAVEYDYISYGAFYTSLISTIYASGRDNRQHVWMTLMLNLRRSLRYGDYFAVGRPTLLAVSDALSINVEDGKVSPIDVTKNLLLQKYLNACNYIGNGFLQYMSSIFGVKPSDTGVVPRFISHRKTVLNSQITNNTADEQGRQTTNLVGISDNSAMDVFIDDFGFVLTLTSFDVLPVYYTGIENTWHFADRFDYFNPNMQNIGDQPIRRSELIGTPMLYGDTFGYTMRNAEYKFKTSKSHGAFVNGLKGFLLQYPLKEYKTEKISPDFIRDKPVYLDSVVPQMTGTSPANYYHFIISHYNDIKAARKIQATPSVLF